ncbi:hypothetical protein OAV41_01715 [Planctomycetota bacterium]|nr:hypothetical protein [Planctomycetota bacterium]
MSETALYNQIGLLQQELALVKEANASLTVERNKYRSQAIMRANKIELLQKQLEQAYE